MNRGSNLLLMALAGGIILPPIILFAVTAILDGYMEGMVEGLAYLVFSYLHILIICVLLIIKGVKIKDTKYCFMGVITILCLLIVFLFLAYLFKGASFKIGG